MKMRIEYETTLENIADTQIRMATRSKLLRSSRWRSTFWTAVLTSVFLFLILSLRGASLIERVTASGLGAIASAAIYWPWHRHSMKRRALKYLREQMQTQGPLNFAVELRDDCIWTRLGETQLLFDWSNVAEMVDSEEGIELRMRDGGYVFVRSKGFRSLAAREQFKEIANNRINPDSGKDSAVGGNDA